MLNYQVEPLKIICVEYWRLFVKREQKDKMYPDV
jgi:hypothetical protein